MSLTSPLRYTPDKQAADRWLSDLYASRAARAGQQVTCSSHDIEAIVGWQVFLADLSRRGFSAIENAGLVTVFCNDLPVQRFGPA
ncbi:N-(5'-phosphoribosyl)anthranilate isomerase [Mesobacterium pallidum]|uniref:N-(5'-phosphoribosyl)anthranilate isomerase n=1 Tax=Mesobacterium pallidum TaxID=2872037 RepID=UPI001EE33735|nr:N-(5'-phosphoribosyl)anthranilate isomerase [Mesobacterium pallidum]